MPTEMPSEMPSETLDLGRVAVLMGGGSAEREVSLMSGEGVLAALRERGVDAHAFDPAERPLTELLAQRVSRVFIALHGPQGEDGSIQGALEWLRIPYTGSGVRASALAADKIVTKRLWSTMGLPTPEFMIARTPQDVQLAGQRLGYPIAVKPSCEGSTLGYSRVDSPAGSEAAFACAAAFHGEVLCEAFVAGRELTVAILGSGETARALPIVEIQAPDGNYDYQNKYFGEETRYRCPADLPAELGQHIGQLSLEAFHSLGCEGWARIDVMLREADQKPLLLEINTSPGMTSHSLVPMAARAEGLSYPDLCVAILASARLKSGVTP